MKLILSLLVLLASATAGAAFPPPSEIEFQLNRMPAAGQRVQLGTQITWKRLYVLKGIYDFTKQGGAIGAIQLLDMDGKAAILPSKAIVKNVLIDVITAPTSGGAATIALSSGQSVADLKAATAFASYTGLVAGIPVNTAATAFKLTANRTPTLTVATAALTAGRINVFVEYTLSD